MKLDAPRLVTIEERTIAGMKLDWLSGQPNPIPELWQRFMPRANELQARVNGSTCYGLCRLLDDAPEDGMEYTAGYEVRATDNLPQGMVARTIPAGTYLVFTHRGGAEKIGESFDYINLEYIPASKYVQSGVQFEKYDERYDPQGSDSSELEIYIAVKERAATV